MVDRGASVGEVLRAEGVGAEAITPVATEGGGPRDESRLGTTMTDPSVCCAWGRTGMGLRKGFGDGARERRRLLGVERSVAVPIVDCGRPGRLDARSCGGGDKVPCRAGGALELLTMDLKFGLALLPTLRDGWQRRGASCEVDADVGVSFRFVVSSLSGEAELMGIGSLGRVGDAGP